MDTLPIELYFTIIGNVSVDDLKNPCQVSFNWNSFCKKK
jgi:hypothetical protein